MPKLVNIHNVKQMGAAATHKSGFGSKSGTNQHRTLKKIKLAGGKSTTAKSRKVTFWAGLRVEGSLSPFGINADDLTRWNEKINNGGLFEKIGTASKQ